MSAVAADLHEWLVPHRTDMVDLLHRTVAIDTPSTTPSSLGPLLDLVQDELEDLGCDVRRVDGVRTGGWLVARRADDAPDLVPQLLVGHLDTVWPVGTSSSRPLRTDGVVARGPGVYDMKAGVVQVLWALRALAALDVAAPVPPVVLLNTDEEIGSRESTVPIATLARHADRVLVTEPSLGPTGRLKTARKGVGRFTITVSGTAAHAGLDPEGGASAILELSHVIQSLFALNDPAAGTTVNVGTIDGGLRPNVVAPESRAVVDVRVATHADAERVERAMRGLATTTPGTAITVEGGFGRPPMERDEGTVRLWELARAAGHALGVTLEEATAGGASDGNTTAAFAPTLDGLGPVGDGAHAETEHIVLDHLVERTALLAALVAAGPVRDAARPLPVGGVPALLASLPTPVETGEVTAADVVARMRGGVTT